MYVNERTIDYGEDGRESVRKFIGKGQEIGMIRTDFAPYDIQFIGSD